MASPSQHAATGVQRSGQFGFLQPGDLIQLTGAARRGGQVEYLQSEGIPFKANRKDELLVAWMHVHAWLEGMPLTSHVEPDLSGVR